MPRCSACRAIRCRAIPDWAGKTVFVDARTASTPASPDRLWRVIEGIGGENGWYSSPLLWAIRGLDGPPRRRHRPRPRSPQPRPTRGRRCPRLLARRGDRARVVPASARRDEGAGSRVARTAGVRRGRRLTLRPAGGVLPAGTRRAAVLARGAAVPRLHLPRHGEPDRGGRGCRGGRADGATTRLSGR